MALDWAELGNSTLTGAFYSLKDNQQNIFGKVSSRKICVCGQLKRIYTGKQLEVAWMSKKEIA